ncbi:hypothetical protein [Chryseobacterium sp. JK1]|uniref:hypothetical protein n=1 Tax=Chryseobacterium sp. JK1 TaxID=874294 RepID=UPI003D682490
MIAPKELRLGNLATIDNPDFHKQMKDIPVIVNGINLTQDKDFPASSASISVTDGKFSYSQFNEFISPIDLTEEWLEKFGLRNSETGYEIIVKQTKFSAIRAKGFFSVGLAGPF